MSANKLVVMANQIATFFRLHPQEEAVASIAQHIKDFWNPMMRREIYALMDAGGEGLEPLTLKALQSLRERDTAAA